MDEKNRSNSSVIWTAVGVSAGVALLISAFVTVGLNLPGFLFNRPREIPDLVGMSVEEAEDRVAQDRFVILETGEEPSERKEGEILEQYPEAGTKLTPGDIIRVVVSRGRPTVDVPFLRGMELMQATQTLQVAGLLVDDVVSQHDTLEEDLVIGTEPSYGLTLERGSKVTLFVSLGPDMSFIPSVTNKKLATAKQIITDNGFKVGDVSYQVTTEYYQGVVMKQSPQKGDLAPRGSKIDLVVAGVLR
ncbi:PASTA domain-containing protein [candidate division WOR-3 bacterium]|uniref:PASTA domain-containing protein n=1 Tax=candidate division WOR-3 bacterium TaxID=2052148 RepID=A0A9D5KAM0_UNCW3|nr:PASTA domain-containing protein [candidate division WOR-3 bacterium]MBD3365446.1 PASTA domain-containing protein [candidate division WOR-3 bacterium]